MTDPKDGGAAFPTNDLTAIRALLADGAYPIGWGHATILSLCDEVERLRELIENASQAASETQPSWEHSCYAITSALGLDFGEPTPDIPEQSGWYARKMKQMEEDQFAKVAEISRLRAENERLRGDRDEGAKDYCNLSDQRDALWVENDRLRYALSNIVHTFNERSDGSLVTFPGGYYQAMARAALGQEGDA